jgi:hypothetical protein
MNPYTTVSFRLPFAEAVALKRHSERHGISLTEACRRAVRVNILADESRDVRAETVETLVDVRDRLAKLILIESPNAA